MNDRIDSIPAAADDWLDRMLAENGREHRAGYLADDGFSARVVAALPAPAVLPAWRKPVILVMWTVAAAGAALAMPGVIADLALDAARLVGRHPISLPNIAMTLIAMGAAGWAGAAYALQREK
jgi:hypothetical protein